MGGVAAILTIGVLAGACASSAQNQPSAPTTTPLESGINDTVTVRGVAMRHLSVADSQVARTVVFRSDTAWVQVRFGVMYQYLRIQRQAGAWAAVGVEPIEALPSRRPR